MRTLPTEDDIDPCDYKAEISLAQVSNALCKKGLVHGDDLSHVGHRIAR